MANPIGRMRRRWLVLIARCPLRGRLVLPVFLLCHYLPFRAVPRRTLLGILNARGMNPVNDVTVAASRQEYGHFPEGRG